VTTTTPAAGIAVSEDDLGASWSPGCPVGAEDLRLLTIRYHGFDGQVKTGYLIVGARWAEPVLEVFGRLFDAGFPIEKMVPTSEYGGDDDASMADYNTSGFNCRTVSGTSRWSEHAYGRAIDINPLINPFVNVGSVQPPAGEAYLERDPTTAGLITDGDVVVEAFASIGWGWGGHWRTAQDYQHFSSTGR
jgi:hypothetical protein